MRYLNEELVPLWISMILFSKKSDTKMLLISIKAFIMPTMHQLTA